MCLLLSLVIVSSGLLHTISSLDSASFYLCCLTVNINTQAAINFDLSVLCNLAGDMLIIRHRKGAFAMRSDTQSMAPVRPKIERRGVGDNLWKQ